MKTKTFTENGHCYQITVKTELNYRKGNSAPYFSITAEIWRSNSNGQRIGRDCESCGCLHEDIEKHFPGKYTDLINLHLSNMNGLPIHAVENGFYWFKESPVKGFDYIRLPQDQRDILIRDKGDFIELVESLKLMYKQHALDCIAKHNLTVTGDTWEALPC